MKKDRRKGISLVETLIAVGILAVVGSIGMINYTRLRTRAAINADAVGAMYTLRDAMNRAASGEGGTRWGVHFENGVSGDDYYVLFSGSSWAGGTKVATTTLSTNVVFTTPASGNSDDIIFKRHTGLPVGSGTSTVALQAENYTDIIYVNEDGRISRDSNYQ